MNDSEARSAFDSDVLIVGAGPAGLTATTYLRRFHRSCIVVDAGQSRARWIPESNNCPGFPHGVHGTDLLQRMRTQAEGFDPRFENGRVDGVRIDGDGFVVSAGPHHWRVRCVVLATGVVDRLPAPDWVPEAIARGALRLCSVCDAFEASDQRIGVYGPAETIGGHARFLRSYSTRVTLLPTTSTDGVDLSELRSVGIDVLAHGGTLRFDGQRVSYVQADGTEETFDTVYPFLGVDTCAALAASVGARLDDSGEIHVDHRQMTSVPGLYAIGDIVSGLNQISVAVGQAAAAAAGIHNALPFAPR
ncbi:NAD(P)/FAD-dependent oxidoreductase [Tahibacter sp.]|uniref:NAD(P)/FAD-dependent oxidoreductase n=1 Tax=Tahibacter sp. TaxID=2056211 RepID=UPI0028C3C330|nr:NAD(P)/FAD-dependent oxidoreductase [Tahibacter sp.]